MNSSEVMNIIGKVEGKLILIDDMIDTAREFICHAAGRLAEAGAGSSRQLYYSVLLWIFKISD